MPHAQTCSKCRSGKQILRARVRGDLGSMPDLCVEVYEMPEALFFKEPHRAELTDSSASAAFVEVSAGATDATEGATGRLHPLRRASATAARLSSSSRAAASARSPKPK